MKKIPGIFISDKVVCNLKKIYPAWEVREKLFQYYQKKIRLCVEIIVIGLAMMIAMWFYSSESIIDENGRVARNGYGGGNKSISVVAETGDGFYLKKHDVCVSERRYTDEELGSISNDFWNIFYKTILGENVSYDYVTTDLNFVNSVDGYPFKITYKTSNPIILSSKGVIDEEHVSSCNDKEDGIDVCVTANITYYDYEEEQLFYVCIFEKKLGAYEQFDRELTKEIKTCNEETATDVYLVLPKEVCGKQVKFTENNNNNHIIMLLLSIIASGLIYFIKDKEIETEAANKEKELISEYPRLINKFTLFYNAGMPIKKIWMKICSDYEKDRRKKNYLYEEMLITKKQMLDGMREIESYEDFAKRVGIKKYRVFINLLIQSIVMGKGDLNERLKIECEEAYLDRKNDAKRKFEEAGTKLLIPMFMMLIVVMIIIIFPAFYSFKM